MAAARQSIAAARLADPGEHFPYKRAHASRLLTDNPPHGPEGPSDNRVQVEDFLSGRIVLATEAYVAAQAAWLEDPSPANKELYQDAAQALVAARQAHRRNRVDADGNPCSAIVATTGTPPAYLVDGLRHRRVGEVV
jgi:hypothetical protein